MRDQCNDCTEVQLTELVSSYWVYCQEYGFRVAYKIMDDSKAEAQVITQKAATLNSLQGLQVAPEPGISLLCLSWLELPSAVAVDSTCKAGGGDGRGSETLSRSHFP